MTPIYIFWLRWRVFGRPLPEDGSYVPGWRRRTIRARMVRRLPWLAVLRWWHLLLLGALLISVGFVALHLRRPPQLPAGTVATVNGKPITEYDLLAEARSAGVEPDSDATRKILLDQVIDRRLLLGAAQDAGLDADPAVRANAKRAAEMVTATAIADRLAGTLRPSSDAEAQRYIAANPLKFGQRRILFLDAVVADLSKAPADAIDAADTMGELLPALQRANIPFERTARRFDTALLPADVAAKMVQAPPGMLFRLPEGKRALIGAITSIQPAAGPIGEQIQAARAAAGLAQRDTQLRKSLKELRRRAEIRAARPLAQ